MINVIGVGLDPYQDLTIAAKNKLESSPKVLTLAPISVSKKLEEMSIKNENILHLYGNGDSDQENYDRIFNYLIETKNIYKEVSLAIPGHPMVGVTIVSMLVKQVEKYKYKVNVYPGVSSFDWMMIDLARDPIARGSMLLDANRLVLLNIQIDPQLDVYLYHICSVGTRKAWYKDPSKDNKLEILKLKLLDFYQEEKVISLVSCGSSFSMNNDKSIIHSTTLKNIDDMREFINFSSTLYIQAEKPKNIDLNYLNILKQS